MGSTRKDLRGFPEDVKDEIGYSLYLAEIGERADNTKKYHGLSGVLEIVSDYESDTYRAVYAYKIDEDLYILPCLSKEIAQRLQTP